MSKKKTSKVIRYLWTYRYIDREGKPDNWKFVDTFLTEKEAIAMLEDYEIRKLEWSKTEFDE
jgi:hypothetical protein